MYTDAMKTESRGPELAKVIQEIFLCKVILKDQGGATNRKKSRRESSCQREQQVRRPRG